MNQLFLADLFTQHVGMENPLGPSPRLTKRIALGGNNPGRVFYGDDFRAFGQIEGAAATTDLFQSNGYAFYVDNDVTIGHARQLASSKIGGVRITSSQDAADGDNHDAILTAGGNTGSFALLDGTKLSVFETMVRFTTVADTAGSRFSGLIQEGSAATSGVILDSTGHALADKNLIGFRQLEGDGDSLAFSYKADGQTVQNVMTKAIVADTWYRLGFIIDPYESARRLKIFIDGVEQSTAVSATEMAAATFPDDDYLTWAGAVKNSANAAARNFDIGFWYFFQEG